MYNQRVLHKFLPQGNHYVNMLTNEKDLYNELDNDTKTVNKVQGIT